MNKAVRSLNICFVSQEYPPETGWGGIGSYIREMAAALTAEGHHIVVLARAVERESYGVYDGVHVYRILSRNGLGTVRLLWRFQRYWEGYRYAVAKKLDEIVKRHDIDIIEAPDIRAETLYYQLMRHTHVPVVLKLHTPRWLVDKLDSNKPALWNRIEYLAEKIAIQKAESVYSCSNALLKECKEYLPHRLYDVVHNPIRSNCERQRERENDEKTVLFVGRIEWRKGVQIFGDVIPNVCRFIPGASFVLLGPDGHWHGGNSLKEHILSRVPAEMQKSVYFPGGVSREEVMNYLQKAAVCVLPSLWENFPYACLEAMASGCAVVGSKNGGMSEMIEDGVSGMLVDPERPDEVADAILKLLADDDLRRKMGKNAADRVRENFSVGRITAQTLEIYRRSIALQPSTHR